MSVIIKHMPSWMIDGREEITQAEFTTLEELLAVDFVAAWKNAERFHRFSLSDDCLMAELSDGEVWWVIGRVIGDIPDGLPKWMDS